MGVMQTPAGPVPYVLERKKIKNINLRVKPGGEVKVSAPLRTPLAVIEAFLCRKAAWVTRVRAEMIDRRPAMPCQYTKPECLAIYTKISDAVFPLFSDLLKGQRPQLKVRDMKSRWGSCNVHKKIITLSMRLAEQPLEAVEYVILHEYVHFLHPNHQAGFHAEMARLMPDYKQRRKLLR